MLAGAAFNFHQALPAGKFGRYILPVPVSSNDFLAA